MYIYHLTEPTGEIRYVGSSFNPYLRALQHLAQRHMNPDPLGSWLRGLVKRGLRPEVRIVVACGDDHYADEKCEIKRLLALGVDLLNITWGNQPKKTARKRMQITARLLAQARGCTISESRARDRAHQEWLWSQYHKRPRAKAAK